ncbi:VanZ family protein [Microbacterium sp. CFBP9034]|uniref:VanZ family protein n=1 Tax=Microbacterium sp. CFBP9034 TaxID=3096540 RepID=UPI002A6A553A|nr:VanZ family protein [Microbacterium sp. CFBP9034]MDY0910159.1 VanZ family protein [Microbacterium sp. CFBP9034]
MTTSTNHASVRTPRRGILILAFLVYLVLLAWVVLWKLEVPWVGAAAGLARPFKLVPFVASGDAGASAPTEVLINLVLFVPFGLFLGALAPTWTWWKAAGVLLGTSLALELAQHLISTGSFDTTDLIVNTSGGLIGYGVFAALRRRFGPRTPVVAARACLTITALALVAVVAFVASPLHYGPQRDVVVQRH